MSLAETPKEGQFLIDLSLSREPRAFRDRHNLWHNDIRRIYRLMARQVRAVKSVKKKRRRGAPHLSIAIFGPAGSGKSSLLHTLADDVRRDSGSILKRVFNQRPNLETEDVTSLPVMDPTTWRTTDQFLYAFLASALEYERRAQDRKEDLAQQGLSPVQLAFQEVNEYLRVLDKPEESQEYDPLGLSLQKLERHTSGLRLRETLGTFIDRLVKEMGAELVLLPVDDLDMAPEHLVDSLKTYQSYLTQPRLVPVFTFTDRMPEELIEVDFRNQLQDGAYIPAPLSETLPISAKMAVQTLARCFPVRNRIRLGPAPARVQRAALRVAGLETEEGPEVLELLITASFLLFGHPDKDEVHQVKAALRPSTLRRQFQVVDAMTDSRILSLRTPQFGWMAGLSQSGILELARGKGLDAAGILAEKDTWPEGKPPFVDLMRKRPEELNGTGAIWAGLQLLAGRLRVQGIDATWATIFNGASWSLLNVHRDILRELGLFLEDLYSWTPRELRSVVVERILAQDRITRRTVLDRWFNRSDYRRSQVLSLLAANLFRPWMPGEEPYGDREGPLLDRRQLEKECLHGLDQSWPADGQANSEQVEKRLTIPVGKGFLWFLNVTMGFYLPQIAARDWADAVSPDEPVRGRMSGNGWDFAYAAINAIRITDAKREILSFGMHFLNATGYQHALEAMNYKSGHPWRDVAEESPSSYPTWRGHLLLRIWTCCGYSQGRYWAAVSLWRGLGLIGQVLELSLQKKKSLDILAASSERSRRNNGKRKDLKEEIVRLIRSHCLNGLAAGAMLSHNTDEEKLLHGFPRWEPHQQDLKEEIERLAESLCGWLIDHHREVIYPLPAGPAAVGWKDCFIRRIHGDGILGSLCLRLNASYLEEQHAAAGWPELAARRSCSTLEDAENVGNRVQKEEDKFRWRASVATGAWSGILLDYWRGCPPILDLMLSCPVFLKSEAYDQPKTKGSRDKKVQITGLVPQEFCIERADPSDFSPSPQHLSLGFKPAKVELNRSAADSSDAWTALLNPAGAELASASSQSSAGPPSTDSE